VDGPTVVAPAARAAGQPAEPDAAHGSHEAPDTARQPAEHPGEGSHASPAAPAEGAAGAAPGTAATGTAATGTAAGATASAKDAEPTGLFESGPRDRQDAVPAPDTASAHAEAPATETPAAETPQAPAGGVPPAGPHGEPPEEPRDPEVAAVVAELEDEVVVVDEQPRYHLAGCRSLPGRPVIPLPAKEAVELGFTPCGWCNPDRTLAGRHQPAHR
jgi:hypothetical protein